MSQTKWSHKLQAHSHSWEITLLNLAHEARSSTLLFSDAVFDNELLHAAYAYCDALTSAHSKSFYLASGLLPAHKRRAVRALYAFCRVTDDIVDQPLEPRAEQLETWRHKISNSTPAMDDLVAVAWADARRTYQVPCRFAEQLIDGVARDIHQTRYQSFEELAAYSYGVASTVGLMSMHIIGYAGVEAIPYAIKLGVALQITNILRDVAEDWQNDRLYLPLEELQRYELGEADIASGQITERWRSFMRFQIARNRRLYREALPGIAMLDRDGRFAIAAAADLYQGILTEIERQDYDVFSQRAHLSKWQKLRRLPLIWWKSR